MLMNLYISTIWESLRSISYINKVDKNSCDILLSSESRKRKHTKENKQQHQQHQL